MGLEWAARKSVSGMNGSGGQQHGEDARHPHQISSSSLALLQRWQQLAVMPRRKLVATDAMDTTKPTNAMKR